MVIFVALTAAVVPQPVHAVGSTATDSLPDAPAAHHESDHHSASLRDLFFPAINFGIYLFIIVRYVLPAMREYLRRRRADLVHAESEARAALARAERDMAASNSRLASLTAETDGIRQDLVAVATRQAKRLIAQAEETGGRRLADASLVAGQERRRALAEVRAAVATAATSLAERQIRTALTADDQRDFVQQFLRDATTR